LDLYNKAAGARTAAGATTAGQGRGVRTSLPKCGGSENGAAQVAGELRRRSRSVRVKLDAGEVAEVGDVEHNSNAIRLP
jgi:hypothetical protein